MSAKKKSKAERERDKAIDKNLRKAVKGAWSEVGHKVTGTTIGLITVPELHAVRTAVLLNQNMPSHTRASLEVLRSVLGKVNDALRYCGEDVSDLSVHTEVSVSSGGHNIQVLPDAIGIVADKPVDPWDGLPALGSVVVKHPEPKDLVNKLPYLPVEKSKPTPVTAESKHAYMEEKRERLGVKSKKKVRDDWD